MVKLHMEKNTSPTFLRNFKTTKKLKKSKCLSFYIIQKVIGKRQPIYLEINEKGNIYFSISNLDMVGLASLEEIVKHVLNSFITEIITTIDQREEVYHFFKDFNQNSDYKIIDLSFKYAFDNQNAIDVSRSDKCFRVFQCY